METLLTLWRQIYRLSMGGVFLAALLYVAATWNTINLHFASIIASKMLTMTSIENFADASILIVATIGFASIGYFALRVFSDAVFHLPSRLFRSQLLDKLPAFDAFRDIGKMVVRSFDKERDFVLSIYVDKTMSYPDNVGKINVVKKQINRSFETIMSAKAPQIISDYSYIASYKQEQATVRYMKNEVDDLKIFAIGTIPAAYIIFSVYTATVYSLVVSIVAIGMVASVRRRMANTILFLVMDSYVISESAAYQDGDALPE